MDKAIHSHFTLLDWGVLMGYLWLTTWIGHRLSGKQATIRDFFLGGRSLPWWAVCGSIIATEISALTFIGVPGMVFREDGNFTYLQWAIGSIIARVMVGLFFVRVFYEREIYSPYDYMQNRLGGGARKIGTVLFFISAILGQSVRLLVTALILDTVLDVPLVDGQAEFWVCILLIGLFAIVWTLMGGMTTVIWTDFVQFGIFVFGGVFALCWLVGVIQGGFPTLWETASEAGKTQILNLDPSPMAEFTLWVALFAMPFQNMAAFGTDQLNAQRMFCCRSARDAGKAIIWSSVGQLVTVLMLLVGAGLWVYYQQNPPNEATAALFSEDKDYVFPVWITTVVPAGITGLILAGAFAAAISSMDSVLAALSQTSMSLLFKSERTEEEEQRMLKWSKISVVIWGGVLALFAVALDSMREGINMVSLAFGMITYVYGPLLAMFLLALSPLRRDVRGIWLGLTISILLTAWVRGDVTTVLVNLGVITAEVKQAFAAPFSYPWLFPITCLITFTCGVLLGRKRPVEAAG